MENRKTELLRRVTTETPIGTMVMWSDDSNSGELIGFDAEGRPVFKGHRDNGAIVTAAIPLCVSPLAWVEGKPVYKGDVLYSKTFSGTNNSEFKVSSVRANAICSTAIYCERGTWLSPAELTWDQPKKPLAVIEGREVFEGDELWGSYNFGVVKVKVLGKGWHDNSLRIEHLTQKPLLGVICTDPLGCFTWSQPKKFLCYVEGKPVFKGDPLYWVTQNRWIVAREFVPTGQCYSRNGGIKDDNDDPTDVAWLENLTWQPLKVKREGFAVVRKAKVFPAKAAAEDCLKQHAIPENWVVSKVEFEEDVDSQ